MTGDRQQFHTALGLSAGVNILLFLVVAWAMGVSRGFHGPVRDFPAAPATPPEEMTVMLSAEPEQNTAPPPDKLFVNAAPGQPEAAPDTKDPRFFSDRNMRAASEADASPDGMDGMATTIAEDDRPSLDLRDSNFRDGESVPPMPSPAAPQPLADAARESPFPANPERTPPEPEPQPPDPDPAQPEIAQEKSPSEPSSRPPENSDPPKDSPALEKPPEAAPLAFRDNTADTIAPIPEAALRPSARRPKPPAQLTRIPDRVPDYRPGLKKTRKLGKISNKGAASVNAEVTAEGRFNAAIRTAIEKNWRLRLSTLAGLANPGLVEVEFEIDTKGRVSGVRLANPGEANPIMQDCALTAIINAKIPPPPSEILDTLNDSMTGGRLRCSFSFLIY